MSSLYNALMYNDLPLTEGTYELLFGYDAGCDEWTKAEGSRIRDIAIEFFRFIERTNIEKPARLYIWDSAEEAVCDPFYVSLHPGRNTLSELPEGVLRAGEALCAIGGNR